MTDVPEQPGHVPDDEGPVSNEWIVEAIRRGCERLRRGLERQSETTGRMADDVRAIKAAVMGDE